MWWSAYRWTWEGSEWSDILLCLAQFWCCNKSHCCIQGEWCRSRWWAALAIEPARPTILNPGHTALQQHSLEPETLPTKVQENQRVRQAQPPEPLQQTDKKNPTQSLSWNSGIHQSLPLIVVAPGNWPSAFKQRTVWRVLCSLIYCRRDAAVMVPAAQELNVKSFQD